MYDNLDWGVVREIFDKEIEEEYRERILNILKFKDQGGKK